MSDTMMLATGAATVAAAICGLGWAYAKSTINDLRLSASSDLQIIQGLSRRVQHLEAKEAERLEKLRIAGAKGKAAQLLSAEKKRADRAAQAKEASARTLAAVAGTPMRSRAQVVAPVKAKRTRAKNTAAEGAAKKAG